MKEIPVQRSALAVLALLGVGWCFHESLSAGGVEPVRVRQASRQKEAQPNAVGTSFPEKPEFKTDEDTLKWYEVEIKKAQKNTRSNAFV